MGFCCSKLDSVEHATSLSEFTFVMSSDRQMFQKQLLILKDDTSIDDKIKDAKVEALRKIVEKLKEYIDYLNNKEIKFVEVEFLEVKLKYKKMLKDLNLLQPDKIESQFEAFEDLIYSIYQLKKV